MFDTAWFWCALAGLFVALQAIPPERPRLRAAALALISIGAIALAGMDWRALLLLIAAVAWTAFAAAHARPMRGHGSYGRALLLISPILLAWGWGKVASAQHGPLGWLFFLGASFLLVKAFSLIRDRLDGKVRAADPVMVAAYLLYFPTYFSGPMHDYGEFEGTLRASERPRGEDIVDIALRFALGLFKVYALAALLAPLSLDALQNAATISPRQLVFGALVYSFVLYFNFSGYTDMVIAASRAIGIKVPENFDRPFLAPSIRDFWRRWHITFSRALTAHVFIPTARALGGRLSAAPLLVPVIAYLVTFLFAGFWHGATLGFLLWGLWHAAGLIAQDLWQRLRRAGPAQRSRIGRVVGIGMTFAYVSAGWVFFVLPDAQLLKLTGLH